jgi:hypothetical protein
MSFGKSVLERPLVGGRSLLKSTSARSAICCATSSSIMSSEIGPLDRPSTRCNAVKLSTGRIQLTPLALAGAGVSEQLPSPVNHPDVCRCRWTACETTGTGPPLNDGDDRDQRDAAVGVARRPRAPPERQLVPPPRPGELDRDDRVGLVGCRGHVPPSRAGCTSLAPPGFPEEGAAAIDSLCGERPPR